MLKHCSIINWRIRKKISFLWRSYCTCKDENVNQLYFVASDDAHCLRKFDLPVTQLPDLCERRKLLTIFNVNFGQKYISGWVVSFFEEQDLYNWLAPFTMPFHKNESGVMFFNFICCFFWGEIIHRSLFYYLKDDGIECILMIIRHILMLLNYELFYMIRCQYVISLDVLLTTIT